MFKKKENRTLDILLKVFLIVGIIAGICAIAKILYDKYKNKLEFIDDDDFDCDFECLDNDDLDCDCDNCKYNCGNAAEDAPEAVEEAPATEEA